MYLTSFIKKASLGLLLSITVIFCVVAKTQSFFLILENHTFSPNVLTIPANTKVKIIIENRDKTAEEFDSFDLNREKMLFSGRKTTVFVGPLPPGKYEYFGEYHPNIARGYITVVEAKNDY